jgi:hypothetical protein
VNGNKKNASTKVKLDVTDDDDETKLIMPNVTFKGDTKQQVWTFANFHSPLKKTHGCVQLGSLRVTARVIQWLDATDKPLLTVLFKDLKCSFLFWKLDDFIETCFSAQRVSPDTKPKLQLQLVPHVGEPQTFTFVNGGGRDLQIRVGARTHTF